MSGSLPASRRRPNNSAPTACGWGTACWPRSIRRWVTPGRTPYPGSSAPIWNPFIALTVAATATTTVQLGCSVFVAPWYPPVQLARQLTSIDVISGGRLLPGFGIGWSPEEYQSAGAPFRRRGAQLNELLDALVALWTANPRTP